MYVKIPMHWSPHMKKIHACIEQKGYLGIRETKEKMQQQKKLCRVRKE